VNTIKNLCPFITLMILFFTANISLGEETDFFSRANCFNNETIAYDYFDPAQYRIVVSHHIDGENNNSVHYVGDKNPVYCYGDYSNSCPSTCTDATNCAWGWSLNTRHAAIHNSEDSVSLPFLSTRWSTKGYVATLLNGSYTVAWSGLENDCNLHLDQFY
jgi:hypothetical protein